MSYSPALTRSTVVLNFGCDTPTRTPSAPLLVANIPSSLQGERLNIRANGAIHIHPLHLVPLLPLCGDPLRLSWRSLDTAHTSIQARRSTKLQLLCMLSEHF